MPTKCINYYFAISYFHRDFIKYTDGNFRACPCQCLLSLDVNAFKEGAWGKLGNFLYRIMFLISSGLKTDRMQYTNVAQ